MPDEQRQPLTDDDDLATRAAHDDFLIKRILKFAVLGCIVVMLAFLTVLFCIQLIANNAFRATVLDSIKNNASVIIVAGFGIIGVSIKK
ncbi:MAG TPA: hypothetical protein VLG92_05675 [Candidatus Saccharimonadia bacterium]|nr:hypothetical protein [Candidatus Saccharimonadia bacterium]